MNMNKVDTDTSQHTAIGVRWYQIDKTQLEVRLSSDFSNGITYKRAEALQKRYGRNEFDSDTGGGLWSRIISQFKSPLVLILVVAGFATLLLGHNVDTAVIFLAVLINVLIGVFQEGRASKAFDRLSASVQKYATVIREGKKKKILASELVVGDVVELDAGQSIPADIRLLEETEFEVNESALTGEWAPVSKDARLIAEDRAVAEQSNMAWMGTLAVSGSARGVVVDIGEDTQIGAIASQLIEKDGVETPIQKNIKTLARFLSIVVVAGTVLIFGLGLLRGGDLVEMVLVAIAIAVSVVPEGLPAAVTVVLAIGMERILKAGGLVRNLLAAETLGSTTVILTDKTGTLTQAQMVLNGFISFSDIQDGDSEVLNTEILRIAIAASDAFIEDEYDEKGGEHKVVHGRPIEKAILTYGLEHFTEQVDVHQKEPRVDFLAFSSENRFAASLHQKNGAYRLYLSGEPEKLLTLSGDVYRGEDTVHKTKDIENAFLSEQKKESKKGSRMIAVAYMDVSYDSIPKNEHGALDEKVLKNLVFAGYLSFNDPIREDVPSQIKIAQEAGARVVMATGDNPETARAIAREAGIVRSRARTVLGAETESLTDKELFDLVMERDVFARMLPSHKLRVVNILRAHDEVVAMTGDGINDAPALFNADIGVAVGSGTDVAKEASDLVLLENSFGVITAAIKEGRRIIDNLKRIVTHLVSTSFGEIFLVMGALVFGVALPILPAQILWVNIIEGGLLNFAFAFEPAEDSVMKRKPQKNASAHLLDGSVRTLIALIGAITGVITLLLFLVLLRFGVPIEEVRTMMFVTLSLDALFFIVSLKSFSQPIWKIKLFNNKFLILSSLISLALLFVALTLAPLRALLQLTTLHFYEVLILVGVALLNIATIEVSKYIVFKSAYTLDSLMFWKKS